MDNVEMIYGEAPLVKVSFSYGTIAEASNDLTPGALSFGYDEDTKAGAIFRIGKLVSSRVLDVVISNTETDGVGLVSVKYVDLDGTVKTHTFNSVSESKISELSRQVDAAENAYAPGRFIVISDEKEIGINYEELYQKVKEDLASEGIGSADAIIESFSNRLAAIEASYLSNIEEEVVEGCDYTTVKFTRKTKDGAAAEQETSTVTLHSPNVDFYDKVNEAISDLESLDSSVNARLDSIESEIGSIDVNKLEWKDVHDLLESYS